MSNKEELLNKITTLRAKANQLKSEADELVLKAQNKSLERMETLEELQILLQEYKQFQI